MLLATFHRVFRPVTAPPDSEQSRERDVLAGLFVGPRLCERDKDDAHSDKERSSNGGDFSVNSVRASLDSDNTPLLAQKHSKHSSQPSMSSTTTTTTATVNGEILHGGPSHVYWKTPHTGSGTFLGSQRPSGEASLANATSVNYASTHSHTPTSPILWGSHSISRSVSSPSLLSPPSNALGTREYKPSSLGRQSSRSLRLPRDSLSASEDSDAESTRSLCDGPPALPKQLSPIHEQQVPFPPHRKLSTDSVRTPDSTRTFDRITTHSAHSAFINRPLKRSLSQTSTSTHLSALSAPAPPVIPPLDLRPNFQAAMGVPQSRQSPIALTLQAPTPRKSRLPVPTLPTVIGSPRQMNANMVSVIYEDGASTSPSARSSAYATAPASPNTPTAAESGERLPLDGLADLFVDPDDIKTNPSRGSADTTGTAGTDTTPRQHPHPASPTSPLSADSGSNTRPNSRTVPRPQNPAPPSTHSRFGTPRNSDPGAAAQLLPLPRSPSESSSFLEHWHQRWLKGLSFGSAQFAHPPPQGPEKGKREVTHACVLFWAGFVAPWCWPIGGWLLSREGEAFEPEGAGPGLGPLLPLWHRHRRGASRGKHVPVDHEDHQHAGGVSCGGGTMAEQKRMKASWYPLVAPSVESLAPSTHSHGSVRKVRRLLHGHGSRGVDPWIARCRVAAAVSGALIFAGFVVAMVFAVGIRVRA